MTVPSPSTDAAAQTSIEIAAKALSLPTVRTQAASLADAAARDGATHRAYLAELLAAEVDARQTGLPPVCRTRAYAATGDGSDGV
jgi:hypothetical protein